MAFDRRPLSGAGDDTGGWTSPDSAARLPGRNPLGVNQWCPLERFTNTLSFAGHLLAPAPGVDRIRNFPARVGAAPAQARRIEVAPLGRDDGRRYVFPGQKG